MIGMPLPSARPSSDRYQRGVVLGSGFLMKNRNWKASSNIISKNYMAGFEESSFCTELAGNVMSHTRFYVSLTIFNHINFDAQFRTRVSQVIH